MPALAGIALLILALSRYRLPYEDGRYYDPHTQVVYDSQAAEVYLIGAIILIAAGLAIAGAVFVFLRPRAGRAKS